MLIRVRGPEGQATLNFDDECTIDAFRQLLAEKTGVPPAQQEVRGGFPPRLLDFPPDGGAAAVAALGLTSGDSLTVTQLPLPAGASAAAAPSNGAPSNGHAAAPASATVAGLSEDEQLARAIALSLGETVPELPAAAPAQPPVAAAAHAAAVQPARARSPVRAHPASASGKGAATPQGAPVAVPLADGTAVVRRIIDSDNSCLFNAVGYVTQHSRQLAPQLRRVIADAVMADPHEWNEAVLGKAPAQYRAWILDPSRWGGAIELSILSRHLGREIAAFDIQTTRVDIYGQDAGHSERSMVIYDGLHYDALAVAAFEGAPEELDVTAFPASGPRCDAVMQGARELAARAHEARQFTDTANFTLRCGVCQIGLKGEKEAVEHAKKTGHTNFSEY